MLINILFSSCNAETKSSIKSSELICSQVGNKTTWLPYPYPSCYKHCRVPDITNASITLTNLSGTPNKGVVKIGTLLEHDTSISISCQSGYNLAEGLTKPLQRSSATTLCKNGNWDHKYECQPGESAE